MSQVRYKIIFQKLSEATAEQKSSVEAVREVEELQAELEEISELRRLGLEIAETKPKSYTST